MHGSPPDPPGVTVIVVAYNHEAYLPDLLSSLDAQTVPPAEVLLCDDVSHDRSRDVMREWARATAVPARLLFNERNLGLTATLNAALAAVETPWYAYISGDDVMMPRRLEKQLALATEGDPAFVYSDALVVDGAGRTIESSFIRSMGPRGVVPHDDFLTLLRAGNWIPAASVLLRTEAVRSAGGYDEELFFEDYDLWLRLARRHAFVHTDDALVAFRSLDTSLGSTRFRDEDDGWQWAKVRIRAKHLGFSRDSDRLIAELISPWLVTLAARGHSRSALAGLFRRCARIRPTTGSLAWAGLASLPSGGPLRVAAMRARRAP